MLAGWPAGEVAGGAGFSVMLDMAMFPFSALTRGASAPAASWPAGAVAIVRPPAGTAYAFG